MTILGGTSFNVSGLTLIPSSDFTLNNVSIYKQSKSSNNLIHTNISSVYKFSNTTNPFIGEASISCFPDELSSSNFANSKLVVHNGMEWSLVPLKTYNIFTQIAQSQYFNQSINELALADLSSTPALTILGNPVVNGLLVFNISADAEVGFYDFYGSMLWKTFYKVGKHSVPVSNYRAGTYLLKANDLSQIVVIAK